MKEILCKKCGEPLAEDDGGRYYAKVCRDCCDKYNLCRDCGGPVALTYEQSKHHACTGWHSTQVLTVLPTIYPMGTDPEKWKIPESQKTKCPKCGHEFTV